MAQVEPHKRRRKTRRNNNGDIGFFDSSVDLPTSTVTQIMKDATQGEIKVW